MDTEMGRRTQKLGYKYVGGPLNEIIHDIIYVLIQWITILWHQIRNQLSHRHE